MKPISLNLSLERFFSDNGVKSKPLIEMFPEVGLCKPPAIVRNVLLPEPDGPIIETNSP